MGHIYSSPRQRAIQTAEPFIKQGSQIILNDNIREIDFGDFEGMTYDEICQQYPKEIEQWANEKANYTFPNGENLLAFYSRVVKGFKEIQLQTDEKENITIFTHGGVIQCIISYLLSDSMDLFWNFKISNCSLTQFYFIEDTVVFKRINN